MEVADRRIRKQKVPIRYEERKGRGGDEENDENEIQGID